MKKRCPYDHPIGTRGHRYVCTAEACGIVRSWLTMPLLWIAVAWLMVAVTVSVHAQNREVNATLQVNGNAVNASNRLPVTCDNCSGGGGLGTDVNVTDRAGRLLGITYGNLAQIQQRTSTLELLVQLRSGGSDIDPRSIRALTSSDQVTIANSSIAVTGPLTDAQLRATAVPVSAAALPLPSNAAQETGGNLASIATNTGRIPSSPATDRATAAAPFSMRLTDGAAFYDTAKTGQLPAALDASGGVKVHEVGTATVNGTVTINPIPTGSNVIGHVIADSGSTTGVTGSVTVVQPTGTSLHAVVDAAPTTAVTNAGLSNIDVLLSTRTKPADQQHTIIDSGTTTVAQGTGANLHAVIDSGTVIATQATGSNLHVSVDAAPTTAVTNAGLSNIPADPAREGGNLATIVTNTSASAASEASIDSKMPKTVNGAQPVIVMQTVIAAPPVLTVAQLGNPLLYRAAMAQFCRTNLCAPTPLGK